MGSINAVYIVDSHWLLPRCSDKVPSKTALYFTPAEVRFELDTLYCVEALNVTRPCSLNVLRSRNVHFNLRGTIRVDRRETIHTGGLESREPCHNY